MYYDYVWIKFASSCGRGLLTSLDVIELRLWRGIILRRRWGGLDPGPGFGGGPELRAGLAGPN